MDPAKFDYSALTATYTTKQMFAFIKERARSRRYGNLLTAVVILPLFAGIVLIVPTYFMVFLFWVLTPTSAPTVIRALLVTTATAVWIGIFSYIIWKGMSYLILKGMRLNAFATRNGLTLLEGPPTGEAGTIFDHGHSRQFSAGLRTPDSEGLTVANYQYTVGSGKNSRTYTYGVIRCNLSRKLPNVLIDATSNNFMKRFSNLGGFGSSQKISLEGDFDQFFNVFCPEGYGRDTLYWLTPELMELLKKYMANYDLEVVDNHVYAYSDTTFQFDQQGILSGLQLANWLQAEFEQNTHRYSDERVAAAQQTNQIATPGRRLSRSTSLAGSVILLAYLLYLAVRIISNIR